MPPAFSQEAFLVDLGRLRIPDLRPQFGEMAFITITGLLRTIPSPFHRQASFFPPSAM